MICEMQTATYRIWIRVTVSISCDDNRYATIVQVFKGFSLGSDDNVLKAASFIAKSYVQQYLYGCN